MSLNGNVPFSNLRHHSYPTPLPLHLSRLQFEARNQKKEAKEMAVIEAMKRREEEEQIEDAAQVAK